MILIALMRMFGIILLGLLVSQTQAELLKCTEDYECLERLDSYKIGADIFPCDPGKICNNNLTLDCSPCVTMGEEVCHFSCKDENGGISDSKPFECEEGEVCNLAYVSCDKCIAIPCDESYECDLANPQKLTINGHKVRCGDEEVCNADYKYPCNACIAGPIEITSEQVELSTTTTEATTTETFCMDTYECDTTNSRKIKINGYDVWCGEGQVCNADYDYPCRACINGPIQSTTEEAEPSTTTTEATTIEVSCKDSYQCETTNLQKLWINGYEVQCIEGQICNADYGYPCQPCIAGPTESTEASTTTKGLPTLKYPPNCNDGFSASYPCRKGPPHGKIYYMCLKTATDKYDYMVKLCKNLSNDAECKNQQDLSVC